MNFRGWRLKTQELVPGEQSQPQGRPLLSTHPIFEQSPLDYQNMSWLLRGLFFPPTNLARKNLSPLYHQNKEIQQLKSFLMKLSKPFAYE